MAFIEARLLDGISYGFQRGIEWDTEIVTQKNGVSRRRATRSRPKYVYSAPYNKLSLEDSQLILDAHNATRGRAFSFRFNDPGDFVAIAQSLGTAIAGVQTKQLKKTYQFGTESIERLIKKPIGGTVKVFANSVEIVSTVDEVTGIVTFTALAGDIITWSGEFDVPVFFASDKLMLSWDSYSTLSLDVDLEEDMAL